MKEKDIPFKVNHKNEIYINVGEKVSESKGDKDSDRRGNVSSYLY